MPADISESASIYTILKVFFHKGFSESDLKASLIPRGVEVSGSLQVSKLDFICGLVAANIQGKLYLQELVVLVPLDLLLHHIVSHTNINQVTRQRKSDNAIYPGQIIEQLYI